jgi:hypothetical protein
MMTIENTIILNGPKPVIKQTIKMLKGNRESFADNLTFYLRNILYHISSCLYSFKERSLGETINDLRVIQLRWRFTKRIDFSKVLPIPDEVKQEDAVGNMCLINYFKYLNGKGPYQPLTPYNYLSNIWCITHWGSLSNAANCKIKGNSLTFTTIDGAPIPVFKKLSEAIPDLSIVMKYQRDDSREDSVFIKQGTAYADN